MRLPRGACPEHLEILPPHGVYPELNEILRYAQNDKNEEFRVRMTRSEGLAMTPPFCVVARSDSDEAISAGVFFIRDCHASLAMTNGVSQ